MKNQVIVNDDNVTSQSSNYFLTFQHPVKYITWAITNPGVNGENRAQGPCYFISLCSTLLYGHSCYMLSTLNLKNEKLTTSKSLYNRP